ncbi:MAG: GTP 3',8-cyclase [Calditrichaeota bacterium]|nr:GTP 3',8-cyclase [Calditrichota bacterium]
MVCLFPHERGLVLRVSVTERCNFRCRYCMPDGPPQACGAPLPFDRLRELVAFVGSVYPIRKLKITGGEPLVRRGLPRFIQQLAGLFDGEISMTTNASRLAGAARALKDAGLSRVNISLDTLDERRFRELTRGRLRDTLAGIEAAVGAGLTPVKLNAVLRKSSWREDVPALLDYAREREIELRFIELMRTGETGDWAGREFVPARDVIDWLEPAAQLRWNERQQAVPARGSVVEWNGGTVRVGWITPNSDPFCAGCNRMRLDSAGRLYRCLIDPTPLPVDELLRRYEPAEARRLFGEYVAGKTAPPEMIAGRSMASLGG